MRAIAVCLIFPTIAASFSSLPDPGRKLVTRDWATPPKVSSVRRAFVCDDEMGSGAFLIGEDPSRLLSTEEAAASTASIYADLRAREKQIKLGVGRRFVVRTTRGFLNIHDDPSKGPFRVDNIVGQLVEGQVVTSVGEPHGDWVQHDSGGWSIAEYNDFTWLEPIEE